MSSESKPLAAFYRHFEKIYGERWGDLFEALRKPEKQVARKNAWVAGESSAVVPPRHPLFDCVWMTASLAATPLRRVGPEELLEAYVMDPASVLAARALDVQDGDRVLDMCAAPGGKTLIVAENLVTSGEIFANDLSPERRDRLKKVIQQYIPRRVRDRVWVTGKDAVQFGLREPDSFDRVLLDAPCSGERHVLENKRAQEEWSPRRGENLATRQYSLLCAALLAVKPGGRIVYSTCSINPAENDGVLDKLLRKKGEAVRIVPVTSTEALVGGAPLEVASSGAVPPGAAAPFATVGEKTQHGVIFLPDRCGFGPLYYAVLERV